MLRSLRMGPRVNNKYDMSCSLPLPRAKANVMEILIATICKHHSFWWN